MGVPRDTAIPRGFPSYIRIRENASQRAKYSNRSPWSDSFVRRESVEKTPLVSHIKSFSQVALQAVSRAGSRRPSRS